MTTEERPLVAYQYSIKCEETAKGLRFSVHVYGNNQEETIESALQTYEKTIAKITPWRWWTFTSGCWYV